MDRNQNTNRSATEANADQANYETFPDVTPRREGGDDALAESSPVDSRSDEKVIAQHGKDKAANTSSEIDVNRSERTEDRTGNA